MMECKECNNDLFKIIVSDCKDCKFNGAFDEEKSDYIHDEKEIIKRKLERTEAFDEGKCSLGESYGNGCYIFECNKCRTKINMPLIDI